MNNKGTFLFYFFFLLWFPLILTLLIDTKIFKNLFVKYYFNQSRCMLDECWDQRNCGFQDSSDLLSFFLSLVSSLVAYTSVSRLPAVENIWRSISAPTARDAKLHASVLESYCLPLFFSSFFNFSLFLFFFLRLSFFSFFFFFCERTVNAQLWYCPVCERVRNVIVEHNERRRQWLSRIQTLRNISWIAAVCSIREKLNDRNSASHLWILYD